MTSLQSSDRKGDCDPNFPNSGLPTYQELKMFERFSIQLRYWSVQSLVLVTALHRPARMRQVSTTMHFWLKC